MGKALFEAVSIYHDERRLSTGLEAGHTTAGTAAGICEKKQIALVNF
jgi:hypothetical protein